MKIYTALNRAVNIKPEDVRVSIEGNFITLYPNDSYNYVSFEKLYEAEELFKRVLRVIQNELKSRL